MRFSRLLTLVFAIALTPVFPLMAFAADAATATTIALGPVIQIAWSFLSAILVAVLPVVGVWAATKLAKWLKIDIDDKLRNTLEQAFATGVHYGVNKAGGLVPATASVSTKNELVKTAAEFVIARFPDTLAHFGFTPDSVAASVEARLADILAQHPEAAAPKAA